MPYDYSGYGVSGGKPSEKNLYADIDAAWQALRTRYGISPENIILYGQSIGTVPTVDLAARYEVGAVVLHSPLMSGMRVAFPNTKRTWFFDAFPSIDKIPKVTSPVLVIHGTEDEVIDFSHGLAIYERCPRAVEPLWVELAGAGPSRAGPNKNSTTSRLTSGPPERRDNDRATAEQPAAEVSPRPINISINVTDADSPAGVRRRIHLRSLSDVTPASRTLAPRARSHSERPSTTPQPSPLHVPLAAPRARSERSSPAASTLALNAPPLLGDPWRKMSDRELSAARSALDPWVKKSGREEGGVSLPQRGKLERTAAVCEACGASGAECACRRCTCERSPRPSPARLQPPPPRAPSRAASEDDDRVGPRRLYKSASQKVVSSVDTDVAPETADPLLETTC
ncbi:unnamed protein product [Chilo suppressalis]|uniref:Serine aminopeptidase S33 domain-containing protein n=1 Tax=Chilo suppressalis TaxID=168631 RepID=A0ABN8BBL3_CHISP|nr:unnamed protein product [Chilo suppressalis]